MSQGITIDALRDFATKLTTDVRRAIGCLSDKTPSDEESYAIQCWLIYLSMLVYDAARGAADLYIAGNTRAAVILQRQLYEYTVRAKYFLQEPEDGIKAFKARKARHYSKLRNLSIKDELRQAIDEMHSQWKSANPEITEDYGQRKFHKMALGADSATGYGYHYEIPSIWAHATLVGFDVFDLRDDKVQISFESVSLTPQIGLASVIVTLLRHVRLLYAIGVADNPLQYAAESQRIAKLLATELGIRPGEWSENVPRDESAR